MTDKPLTHDEIAEVAGLYQHEILGLGNWNIKLQTGYEFDNSDDADRKQKGEASCDPRYFNAVLTFSKGIAGESGKVTVIHELLHILFAEMDFYMHNYMVGEFVPKKHRQHAYGMYCYHQERIIEHLARQLAGFSARVKEAKDTSE